MSWSLDEIQSQISTEIDQTTTAPSASSTDYGLRRTFVNKALKDFAEVVDWPSLLTEINSRTSVGSSLATIPMAANFRKLASFPKISWNGTETKEYPEIDATQIGQYLANDQFIYLLRSGATTNMIIHPGSITSGASIYIPYYRIPASLASGIDIADIPDPSYLVQKTLYYLYKSVEDARFQEADQKAELILQRMVENEFTRGEAYQGDRAKTWLETKHRFRVGRD